MTFNGGINIINLLLTFVIAYMSIDDALGTFLLKVVQRGLTEMTSLFFFSNCFFVALLAPSFYVLGNFSLMGSS